MTVVTNLLCEPSPKSTLESAFRNGIDWTDVKTIKVWCQVTADDGAYFEVKKGKALEILSYYDDADIIAEVQDGTLFIN